MLPSNRKALHATLDAAIHLGASFTVMIHPVYEGDESTLKTTSGLLAAYDNYEVSIDSGENHVTFGLTNHSNPIIDPASVIIFDAPPYRHRPEPVPNGAKVSA